MARMLVFKYSGQVRMGVDAIKSITSVPDTEVHGYKSNWVYYNPKVNVYWYENKQGWLHILGVGHRELNYPKGRIMYYIRDFLVTKDGRLKVTRDYDSSDGLFPSRGSVLAELGSMVGKSLYV